MEAAGENAEHVDDGEATVAALMEKVEGDARFAVNTFRGASDVTFLSKNTSVPDMTVADPVARRELEENTLPIKAWPAAFTMAAWLQSDEGAAHTRGKSVLELGSGVGLAGLAAAVCARNVVLSDISLASVALCRLACRHPRNEKHGFTGKTAALRLRWGSDDDAGKAVAANGGELFDVVVGADVFYFRNSLKLGLATAGAVLAAGGVFFCASAVRSDEMEDALYSEPKELPFPTGQEGQVHTKFAGILLFSWRKVAV
ncbi:hypothetical protein DIPPA_64171 [Diplonema papillatum]|nr:hypothetical protein DIPPA_64171 [Diplonema papillatum]